METSISMAQVKPLTGSLKSKRKTEMSHAPFTTNTPTTLLLAFLIERLVDKLDFLSDCKVHRCHSEITMVLQSAHEPRVTQVSPPCPQEEESNQYFLSQDVSAVPALCVCDRLVEEELRATTVYVTLLQLREPQTPAFQPAGVCSVRMHEESPCPFGGVPSL